MTVSRSIIAGIWVAILPRVPAIIVRTGTTIGGCAPGVYTGSSTMCLHDSSDNATVTRLTMRKNGRSAGLRPGGHGGKPPVLEFIHFSEQFQIMGDGCFVEAVGNPSPTIHHCWSHDSGKSALRFDGYYTPSNLQTMTSHGQMLHNVGWNVTALAVKGDWHNVSRNTVFDGPPEISPNVLAHSLPRFQDSSSSLQNTSVPSLAIGAGTKSYDPRADQNTRVSRNIFDAIGIKGTPCPSPDATTPTASCPPGIYSDNVVAKEQPFDIKQLLRDPWNWDFRPCPGSRAALLSAGAYDPSSTDSVYWIPGARLAVPSTPVPKDHGTDVVRNTDLIFLGAYRATGHAVFFGTAADGERGMAAVAQLHGDANVVALPRPLAPGARYIWRVDAQLTDGSTRRGDVWTFAAGPRLACPRDRD